MIDILFLFLLIGITEGPTPFPDPPLHYDVDFTDSMEWSMPDPGLVPHLCGPAGTYCWNACQQRSYLQPEGCTLVDAKRSDKDGKVTCTCRWACGERRRTMR